MDDLCCLNIITSLVQFIIMFQKGYFNVVKLALIQFFSVFFYLLDEAFYEIKTKINCYMKENKIKAFLYFRSKVLIQKS